MNHRLWQVEIRSGGEPAANLPTARRVLEILNVVPDDGSEPHIEPEDPENGIYLVELPPRYDEDLERAPEWAAAEPLESGDGYEIWVPMP